MELTGELCELPTDSISAPPLVPSQASAIALIVFENQCFLAPVICQEENLVPYSLARFLNTTI